jgi:hypothetical protein
MKEIWKYCECGWQGLIWIFEKQCPICQVSFCELIEE